MEAKYSMGKLKQSNKYYFTVEGETEKWYFEWLQKTINEAEFAEFKVSFDCKIQKNPLKRAKTLNLTSKTEIYHISDYESNDEIHAKEFMETMDNLKQASSLGRQINYKFGYSNFTFDLWMILHKSDCNVSFGHRSKYIKKINDAYGKTFENMHQYKHEVNFKRVLSELTLDDVRLAIDRSKAIMNRNKENHYVLHEYKGYQYYKENPSLMIWEPVEKILIDCGIC